LANLGAHRRVSGRPDHYGAGFRHESGEAGADAALAAAKKHIRPHKALIVVVGKAADIKPALEAYGSVTVVDTDGKLVVKAEAKPSATPAPAAAPAAAPAKTSKPAPAAPAKESK
ncbi:MAG: hypothetical protein OXT09_19210, partial [Myxococcales bacterium]|nr:hypothetical protein [Myxococcales bacterium]